MVYSIPAAIVIGFLAGSYLEQESAWVDGIVTYSLALMVFLVGVDIGRNRKVWADIRSLGFRIATVPLAIATGSIAGAAAAGLMLAMPMTEAAAVGAGFGWYSLSGVLLAKLHSVELGTTAFIANVIRELLAFVTIPFLARGSNPLTAIAPGGATTMDSTLPLITKLTDARTSLIAFLSGLILTALVPVLVPALISL